MAKFYVQSGTLQMVTEAEDARGAALWALHRGLEQVLPLCADDPQTPWEKSQRIAERGCDVLAATIQVSERGFASAEAQPFDTAEIFAEWNQLLTAMRRLEQRLGVFAATT